MIIDPDMPDHWKTRMLVDLLGGDEMAPLYLIRLWGHCQNRKKCGFDSLPPAGLKALCRFQGDADAFDAALAECGFISREGSSVTVCGWDEHNSSLVAAWENGKRGGRPRKPTGNQNQTQEKPSDNPNKTQHKPSKNPAETDREEKRREERKGEEETEKKDQTQEKPSDNPNKTQHKPSKNPAETDREEKRREERKGEEETEKKDQNNGGKPPKAKLVTEAALVNEFSVDPQVAADYLQVRKAKKSPLTPTAWKSLTNEFSKAGLSVPDGVRLCVVRGWVGFKADWNIQGGRPAGETPQQRAERMARERGLM